jgi:hypothetical protein
LVCHGTIGFPLHCGSSFLNDLGWCWIPDLSSRLSKYLLFIQEKYSWFTFYLGTIDFPFPVYILHIRSSQILNSHRVSISERLCWVFRTSNVILSWIVDTCWTLHIT